MDLLATLNPEHVAEAQMSGYPVREAARAVVVDHDGLVALLHVSKKNYYKLPGGGIEKGEDAATALNRECLEEIGCDVKLTAELGMIVEYRKLFGIKQVSFCFIARVVGEKGEPRLEPDEIAAGFEVRWLAYEEALAMESGSNATDLEGSGYIVPRDTLLLKVAGKHFAAGP